MQTIKAKVHMLPTEDDYTSIVVSNKGELEYTRGEQVNGYQKHLYITTDEEIKLGVDTALGSKGIGKYFDKSDIRKDKMRKVISSTDKKLGLPQIPQSFIEEYCKAGGIDEIEVEYVIKPKNDSFDIPITYLPKLKPDNTIIIHPVEEKMYSREQVMALCMDAFRAGQQWVHDVNFTDNEPVNLNKWIEENL